MSRLSACKEKILTSNGYKYHFLRMIYFNTKAKKIFSYEVIADHDEAWLEKSIQEPSSESWQFYFNPPPPSETLKKEVISELER